MNIGRKSKREAKQIFRLCLVNGLLDENRARQVAQSVASAGRRNSPAILSHFLRLVKLNCAQHTANVESAVVMDPDLQASTLASLTRLYGPGMNIAFFHRPSLIGGMRIQVGSDVYDGSILAGLRALENSF
jgi:F-type H+-transporting ATPase subunit delta